jgi:hypothetical protein
MSVRTIIGGEDDVLPIIQPAFIYAGVIFVQGSCLEIAQLSVPGLARNMYIPAEHPISGFICMFKPGTPNVTRHGVTITRGGKVVLDLHYNDTGELRDEQGLPLPPDTMTFIDSLMYLCCAKANQIV